MHYHVICLAAYQKGTHGQHEPDQHRREGAAVHNVLFRNLHLPGHDEQQYNADDQKQNAADQINRVLDVLLLELRAPVIQSCFDAFYQIFHLFPLLFKYKSRGRCHPLPLLQLFVAMRTFYQPATMSLYCSTMLLTFSM